MFGFKSEQAKLVSDVIDNLSQMDWYDDSNENNKVIFQSILIRLKKTIDYESASLFLINRSNQKLELAAEQGEGINLINLFNFPMGSGLSAWIAQKKRSIHLPDIHKGTRHGHNPVRSFVAMPIIYKDEVLGVLNMAHTLPNAFGPNELKKLKYFAESVAQQFNDLTTFRYRREY